MSDLNLQLNLFEETTTSIEVSEIDGSEVGGILQYYDLDKHRETEITTCIGDITVIINALEDYARMLEAVIKEWSLEEAHAYIYELHAARCRKISAKYQKATGYDYKAAMEKCRKRRTEPKDDVGEEALTLVAKYGKRGASAKDNPKAAPAGVSASEPSAMREDPAQMSFLPSGK